MAPFHFFNFFSMHFRGYLCRHFSKFRPVFELWFFEIFMFLNFFPKRKKNDVFWIFSVRVDKPIRVSRLGFLGPISGDSQYTVTIRHGFLSSSLSESTTKTICAKEKTIFYIMNLINPLWFCQAVVFATGFFTKLWWDVKKHENLIPEYLFNLNFHFLCISYTPI